MINKNYFKLLRSKKNNNYSNFIYDTISKRIIDSIDLLRPSFNNILEIGMNDNEIFEYLKNKYNAANLIRTDIINRENINKLDFDYIKIDLDNFNVKSNQFDLIYSNFFCHLTSNFDLLLSNIKNSLISGGFFIASIPQRDNIFQIVNSMYDADNEFYNGAYQRINPTFEIEYIFDVLKKLDFSIPTLNSDSFDINYSSFNKLLKDIKDTNISYIYNDKRNFFENKKYFEKLEHIYKKKYFDGNYQLSIKFNIISTWKK